MIHTHANLSQYTSSHDKEVHQIWIQFHTVWFCSPKQMRYRKEMKLHFLFQCICNKKRQHIKQ